MDKKNIGALIKKAAQSLILIALVTLAGCASPGIYLNERNIHAPTYINHQWMHPTIIPITPQLVAMQRTQPHPYRVAPNDVLNIIVWGHPEISTLTNSPIRIENATQLTTQSTTSLANDSRQSGILVSVRGTIFFPYAGKVKVSGMTVDQIRRMLSRKLKTYVINPQVSVRVSDYRSQQVYILGQVLHEQMIPITDKQLTLLAAINYAGGLSQDSADASHIYVFRATPNHLTIYWLNAKSPQSLVNATYFVLHPNDIVYISADCVSRWNRLISQITPTLQTIVYTRALVHW